VIFEQWYRFLERLDALADGPREHLHETRHGQRHRSHRWIAELLADLGDAVEGPLHDRIGRRVARLQPCDRELQVDVGHEREITVTKIYGGPDAAALATLTRLLDEVNRSR